MKPAGLILAAGESRRMGSPKALLAYRGETFLDRLIALFSKRCSPVIVVLGAAEEEVRARVRRPASFVVNHEYRLGQTSSMQCGLRAIPEEAAGVLFTLVDRPAVTPETIDALLADPHARLYVPRYEGKRGHPIWFRRDLIQEFLALSPDAAARDVVRRHEEQTQFLDVNDVGILANIDDPVAYRELTGMSI